jgi:hypothetical protein
VKPIHHKQQNTATRLFRHRGLSGNVGRNQALGSVCAYGRSAKGALQSHGQNVTGLQGKPGVDEVFCTLIMAELNSISQLRAPLSRNAPKQEHSASQLCTTGRKLTTSAGCVTAVLTNRLAFVWNCRGEASTSGKRAPCAEANAASASAASTCPHACVE